MLSSLRLEGKIALVTGGAGGIGSAVAADLSEMGAKVAIADFRREGLEAAAQRVEGLHLLELDLRDIGSLADRFGAMKAAIGAPDILVNNAGLSIEQRFEDTSPEDWDAMFAVNLLAPMELTRLALPEMLARDWGRVVCVSSDAGRVGSRNKAVYAASKGGLIGFAKALALDVARRGVNINVVCPGPVDTPIFSSVIDQHEGLRSRMASTIPIGRIGGPEEVSGMISYLCTARASYVTGQVISVNGGLERP